MAYRSSLFSEEIYRELTKKLSEKEEEKLRREIHRLEQRQRDTNSRLWDDLVRQRVRLVIITSSGRRFVLNGSNWPSGYQDTFDEPAALAEESTDAE